MHGSKWQINSARIVPDDVGIEPEDVLMVRLEKPGCPTQHDTQNQQGETVEYGRVSI